MNFVEDTSGSCYRMVESCRPLKKEEKEI